ncbi:hypothetical protein E3P89_02218 [Wallemia ichthyophaga]|uniref:Uncharacterized protein n=1 Tax=Wallemia ichthyophaga TaxID=245174 RepID=A0A4T0HGC8_WALIC|nr:hypothetical protein E3P90_02353 [Wallemia ichthyophaga]TIB13111.1 hypothetical protein E3P93_02113 [Wallemia ichthyophaga]TIB22260.1 hypothetical protein E3P89_02218 [Wallemia ichthyophaga]TIB24001.1 hypothetical protein E3P88_02309 [Wallemia ichthyophaga]
MGMGSKPGASLAGTGLARLRSIGLSTLAKETRGRSAFLLGGLLDVECIRTSSSGIAKDAFFADCFNIRLTRLIAIDIRQDD